MTQDIKTSACPLCQQANQCNVESGKGCWCNNINIPTELTELVPLTIKEKACICRRCVTRFNLDPALFLKSFTSYTDHNK